MTKRISSLTTQFRSYDQGIHDWLRSWLPSLDDGKDIPIVIAPPDRAFAAMARLLKIGSESTVNIRSIPLPFVSVSPGRLVLDPERYHGPVRLELGKTESKSSSYVVNHPLPYDITYRIEYWSKNVESMNAMRLMQGLAFSNGYEAFIPVDLSCVWPKWNKRLIPVENDTSTMSLEVDADGEGHRIVRSITSCVLRAWLIPDVSEVKNVHQIIMDTYVAHTEENIHSISGDEVDGNAGYLKVDTQTIE